MSAADARQPRELITEADTPPSAAYSRMPLAASAKTLPAVVATSPRYNITRHHARRRRHHARVIHCRRHAIMLKYVLRSASSRCQRQTRRYAETKADSRDEAGDGDAPRKTQMNVAVRWFASRLTYSDEYAASIAGHRRRLLPGETTPVRRHHNVTTYEQMSWCRWERGYASTRTTLFVTPRPVHDENAAACPREMQTPTHHDAIIWYAWCWQRTPKNQHPRITMNVQEQQIQEHHTRTTQAVEGNIWDQNTPSNVAACSWRPYLPTVSPPPTMLEQCYQ